MVTVKSPATYRHNIGHLPTFTEEGNKRGMGVVSQMLTARVSKVAESEESQKTSFL